MGSRKARPQGDRMTAAAATLADSAALFPSTHNALRFAFEFSPEQYGEGTLAGLLKRAAGIGSGKGLIGLGGAAPAGMILAEVWRLPALERHAIIARYGQRRTECRCCGSPGMSEEWKLAVEGIAAWAVPAGLSNHRARREIVGRFFTRSGTVKEIAERYGLERKRLGEQVTAMEKRIKDLEARAQSSMDDVLKQTGVVG